ncbi:hypothetical protein BC833DRAFT_620068 [Globomyces pollinis-pini]|nr:hypothetical protein BC833DRAFT_620068 [Globomyces pollinis-pini]
MDHELDAEFLDQSNYPLKPYHQRIQLILEFWINHKPALPQFFHFIFNQSIEDSQTFTKYFQDITVDSLTVLYNKLNPYIDNLQSGKKESDLDLLLQQLDLFDIQLLLGLRRTLGSIDSTFPPNIKHLIESFNTPFKPVSKLTTGARAFSKHIHRSKSNWFGVSVDLFVGTESNKNQLANKILLEILKQAIWFNIHRLPHDIFVLEIRVQEGFGLRWNSDGSSFRGFLEPMMENGHELGWVHD